MDPKVPALHRRATCAYCGCALAPSIAARSPDQEESVSELHGVLVPIVTPFTADGERIDETEMRSIVDRLIDEGVHGLIPCGSTGEFTTLFVVKGPATTEI